MPRIRRAAPTRLDETERAVRDALNRLDKDWRRIPSTDRAWTRAIKHAVGNIGRKRGYRVYAAASKFERHGEWVFDLGWLEMDGELVIDIPLALESEWRPADVMDDLQKLLISRAGHRVMVMWTRKRAAADSLIETLKHQIAKYSRTQKGDRYLFCCWVDNPSELMFCSYVVK